MRFTMPTARFAKALATAGRAIPGVATNAFLLYYKIAVTDSGVEVTASNGGISIWTSVPFVEGDETVVKDAAPGAALFNARVLNEIVRRLDGSEITIDVVDRSFAKLLCGDNSDFSPSCRDADEFPDIDFEHSSQTFKISGPDLAELCDQTVFATDPNPRVGMPVIGGVNILGADGTLTATGTDRARLSQKKVPCDPDLAINCTIPADSFREIARLFEDKGEVTFSASEERAVFSCRDIVATTRLISGRFPQVRIPDRFLRTLVVSSRQFIAAVERVLAIATTEKTKKITLSCDGEVVKVTSYSDANGEATETLRDCSYSGPALDIGLSGDSVIAAIRALGSEDVTFAFGGEKDPFLIHNPDDPSIVELLSPRSTDGRA